MRSLKISLNCFMVAGLLILGACGRGEKVAPTSPQTATTTTPTPTQTSAAVEHGKSHPGGTTIETNGIHLELVPEKLADKTHLDLYVQTGENHEPIPTAKVIAQIQSPDGEPQRLNMKYSAIDKHYTAIVPTKTAGQYQVKITADINGKKVDGRFTFDKL